MNDLREMYRAAPGLVISVGSMLACAAALGLTALLIT
jgi:hypothetical protein